MSSIQAIKRKYIIYKQNGFLSIFIVTVVNKMLSFIGTLFIVRLLTKSDYGFYNYGYNLVTIALLASGLGIEYGVQQFCSERIDSIKRKSYFRFGLLFGVMINVLICLGMYIVVFNVKLSIEGARNIVYALIPIVVLQFLLQYSSVCLRVTFQNIRYANLLWINSFSRVVLSIVGAFFFSIYGYIAGIYLSFILAISYVGVCKWKSIVSALKAPKLDNQTQILKYSLSCAINHGLTNVLYTIDILLLGIMIADEKIISVYKVGIALPMALYAIPTSVMMVAFPYFARSIGDKKNIIKLTKKLLSVLLIVSLMLASVMIVFASIIVPLMYGNQYAEATSLFRLCAVTFVFAAVLKIPLSNILSSQRLIKFNLYCSVITTVVNIIADIGLVYFCGYMGAAYATLTVTVLSSLISLFFFKRKIIDEMGGEKNEHFIF